MRVLTNILHTAASSGQFHTLLAAIERADLDIDLEGAGPFTVFAPTDEAFERLPRQELDSLMRDKVKLRQLLEYHVTAGRLTYADVKSGNLPTIQGRSLAVSKEDGEILVDEAKVREADIVASNGVIHAIDRVVMPPL
jgi:uncharacterized surface protein with fasciclin (FAS1) repeats